MKILKSLPFRLLVALTLGLSIGFLANESVMTVVVSIRHLAGQIVFFCVPLIIIGSVAPSIAKMGTRASRLLGVSILLAYGSATAAAFFSLAGGYAIIPRLFIPEAAESLRTLPALVFELNIPPIMPVMSALALSLLGGLGVAWTKSTHFSNLLAELQRIVLSIVRRVVIPTLPIFIAATFATLAYDGRITQQIPIFLQVLLLIVLLHLLWLAILYILTALYSKRNPFEVIKHYGPTYLTGAGTMSSAATLAVALRGAQQSKVLRKDMVGFGIPLFAHIHMCGSTITIVFLSMTVSQVLYGTLPSFGTMVLFIFLLGIFAVAAPGVPGGTLMASLGLITAVLGFTDTGIALMLTIFALQDSSGTATNISSDGAMIMALSRYSDKRGIVLDDTAESVF